MAHFDLTEKPDPVTWKESSALLASCQELFKVVYLAATGDYFAFEVSDPKSHLASLMSVLGDNVPGGPINPILVDQYWGSTGL